MLTSLLRAAGMRGSQATHSLRVDPRAARAPRRRPGARAWARSLSCDLMTRHTLAVFCPSLIHRAAPRRSSPSLPLSLVRPDPAAHLYTTRLGAHTSLEDLLQQVCHRGRLLLVVAGHVRSDFEQSSVSHRTRAEAARRHLLVGRSSCGTPSGSRRECRPSSSLRPPNQPLACQTLAVHTHTSFCTASPTSLPCLRAASRSGLPCSSELGVAPMGTGVAKGAGMKARASASAKSCSAPVEGSAAVS